MEARRQAMLYVVEKALSPEAHFRALGDQEEIRLMMAQAASRVVYLRWMRTSMQVPRMEDERESIGELVPILRNFTRKETTETIEQSCERLVSGQQFNTIFSI